MDEPKEDGNKDDDISINLCLSVQCYEDGHYEEAIRNGKKCLQMATENGNRYAEMNTCLVIGDSELKLKEYMRSFRMEMKNDGVEELEMKDALAYGDTLVTLGDCDKEFKYAWWSVIIGDKPCEAETNSALGEYEDIISYCMRALNIAKEMGDKHAEMKSCLVISKAYRALRNYDEAIEYSWRCIDVAKEIADKHVEMEACLFLTETYKISGDCKNTIQCALMLRVLAKENDDKNIEMEACFVIMKNYQSLKQYKDAVKYAKMYLEDAKETGDKRTEMETCVFIANAQRTLTNYTEAVKYAKMNLEFAKDKGDKHEEMKFYLFISNTQFEASNYTKAVKYGLMYADAAKEIGDKRSEIHACVLIWLASRTLESYDDVIQYATKRIEQETDDQGNKKIGCFLLGHVDCNLKKYDKAVSQFRKALDHAEKEGDEYGEMVICYCLGEAYMLLNQLDDAISCCESSFQTAKKIGDKENEMNCSLKLSGWYAMLNRSDEVESYATNAKEIAKELDDKEGQKKANIFLGNVYHKSNQEGKATACLNECADISKESGDVLTELFASMMVPFSNLSDAKKLIEKEQEMMNRFSMLHPSTLTCYETILPLHCSIHDSLMSFTKISSAAFAREAMNYAIQCMEIPQTNSLQFPLQPLIHSLEQLINEQLFITEEKAAMRKLLQFLTKREQSGMKFHSFEEYLINITEVYNTISNILKDFLSLHSLQAILHSCKGIAYYLLEDIPNAKASFEKAIRDFESLFDNLHNVDKSKISTVDRYVETYKLLSKILIEEGNTEEALLVAERCRGRALKDILFLQYGLTKEVLQEGYTELDDILPILKTHKFTLLFYTVSFNEIHKFVMEDGKSLHFSVQLLILLDWRFKKLIQEIYEELDVTSDFRCQSASWPFSLAPQLFKSDEFKEMTTEMLRHFFGKKNALKEGTIPEISDWNGFELQDVDVDEGIWNEVASLFEGPGNIKAKDTSVSPHASSCFDLYTIEGESSSTSALETLSQMLLGNVSLEQDEVVIIPDGLLSIVPFAALTNPATGRYLSEDKKIRFAPSLSTLKLLSESREDFHTLKGAIFIGDPDVSRVLYNGKPVGQLQNARIEATAIASKFNVTPLIEEQATKDSVREKLREGASVVHIAAHGDLNKATILLAPDPEVVGVPKEEDYVLTMAEVQQDKVRAQLVVLSCCHSGRGEIRAEGVVGMCRAFLASGARAVVASLWAVSDEATLEFMLEFYDRLQDGESASTSLQMAMNYLRETFGEPKYWAPFILMGDDVKITF